jgi:hypothetical protein
MLTCPPFCSHRGEHSAPTPCALKAKERATCEPFRGLAPSHELPYPSKRGGKIRCSLPRTAHPANGSSPVPTLDLARTVVTSRRKFLAALFRQQFHKERALSLEKEGPPPFPNKIIRRLTSLFLHCCRASLFFPVDAFERPSSHTSVQQFIACTR